MKYYDDSQITTSKINIGKRATNDAALLGYAVAPEITPKDFSINILYSDNPYESRYVPAQSLDGTTCYLDVSNILNCKNLQVTDRFDDDGNPLFYKEVIEKQAGDSLQVIKDGEVVFNGFTLDSRYENRFVVYHNFSREDDAYLIRRRQGTGFASELKKIPLCFSPTYREISADVLQPIGSFRIDPDGKRITLAPDQQISTKIILPQTRHSVDIEYGVSGTGSVDYESDQVEFNVGVLPLYSNDYTQNDASAFIKRLVEYSAKQYKHKIILKDPLDKGYIISLSDFQSYHSLYDILFVVGNEDDDSTLSESLIGSKAYESFVDAKKTVIFDSCGTIKCFKLDLDKIKSLAALNDDDIKIGPLKRFVTEVEYDSNPYTFENMYVQNLYWEPQPVDAIAKRTLTVSNLAYKSDDRSTSVDLAWSEKGWTDTDKAIVRGEVIRTQRFLGFGQESGTYESSFVDRQSTSNVILSELGFCKVGDNLNFNNQLTFLMDCIKNLNEEVGIAVKGLKDVVYSKNSLFANEAEVIGYDRIVVNGQDYMQKIVSTDVQSLLASHTKYPLSNIKDIEIEFDQTLKKQIDYTNTNNSLGFYSTAQLSQSLHDTSYYCMVDKANTTYKLDFSIMSHGKGTRLSKNIQASYIPRKQYISLMSLVSQDAITTVLAQDQNAKLVIARNPNLNLMIYDAAQNRYLSDALTLEIRLASITPFVNLEISAVKYTLNVTNHPIAVKSINGFANCIRMPNGLKTYQNWSPLIENMEFSRSVGPTRYFYKTKEFYNQSFDQYHTKVAYKEECVSAGWNQLQLQHENISTEQKRSMDKERLIQITDYVFLASHKIDTSSKITIINNNSEEITNGFTVEDNIVRFNSPQITTGIAYYISYSYDFLRIYGLSTKTKQIKHARTMRYDNVEYMLRLLDYRNYVFVSKENIQLYTYSNGVYQAVDKSKYFIDEITQSIVISTGDANDMRKQYYVSGLIADKTEYDIDYIDYKAGAVFLKDRVDFRDTIFADYLYEATAYEFFRDGDNILDLNPLRGHSSIYDGQEYKGKDLINKKCYIVLFPYQSTSNSIVTNYDWATTRFTFDEKEADLWVSVYKAIKLGSIALINNFDLSDVAILDARSLGGGLKDSYSVKDLPIAKFWHDLENVSDHVYRPGGFLVVRLPKQLLKAYGGVFDREYVETVVSHYQPLGCHYKIEFYDIFDTDLIPRKDLEIPYVLKQDLIDKYFTYKARD